MKPLNIFYQEPDPDRWIKFDRFPRRIVKQLIRGKARPGGVMTVAINLMKGLDKIGQPYRLNDFAYIKSHPDEIACIIGKPHVLFDRQWKNPIIFGAGIFSHPIDRLQLLEEYPNIKRLLVPGEWMYKMFQPYYSDKVIAWPTGIDTNQWSPNPNELPEFDFLIYDKVRWKRQEMEKELILPVCTILDKHKLSYRFIKYGNYEPQHLDVMVRKCKAAIFLCEHETQGLAYQQILSTDTPILAWDRQGYWEDPSYFPDKVLFKPVSSVPYWDDRCGIKFANASQFERKLFDFQSIIFNLNPRDYINENLSLERCAQRYLEIYREVEEELK